MSASGPEVITDNESAPPLELEGPKMGLADIDSVINPSTETPVRVEGIHVVLIDGVMQVQVEPAGFSNYSLRAVLSNGQEALLYPMRTQTGESIGLTPIQVPRD